MIRLTSVAFAHDADRPALRDISFSLPPGCLAILAGANGAGKTTLMALLAGILAPDSGRLSIDNHESPDSLPDIRLACRLTLQEPDLQILGATVAEDLLLCGNPEDPDFYRQARDMARRLDLLDLWDRPTHTLSHGQKRKLTLAAALVHPPDEPAPKVLLLDEPLSGLDYPAILELRRILADNKRAGLTQIVSSHDLDPLADLAEAILVLDRGRMPLQGPPETVLPLIAGHGVRPPCSWILGAGVTAWT